MEKIVLAKNILLDKGIKITPQRIAVYTALGELGHACAEQVVDQVHKKSPTITVATIYNVLDCFVKGGIVSMVNTSENRMYFDITTTSHHHLMSESGRVEDFEDHELDSLIREYLKNIKFHNFAVEDINLQIKGRFKDN